MIKRCRVNGQEFEITSADLNFYEKMGVPPPTLCPEERARLRMAVANQRHLFSRTCPVTGKRLITNYPPEVEAVIYDIELWWSDRWDQHASARDFDFSRPFFAQFHELMKIAPRPNLLRGYQFDENSDYTHHADHGEWGEFFPPFITPFPYNLTHAMDFLPLTKDQALRRGFSW